MKFAPGRSGLEAALGFAAFAGVLRPAIVGCQGERIVLGEGPLSNVSVTWPNEDYGPPEVVAELAASGDDDDDDEKPTLTADRLELFFLSTRSGGPGGGDVWHASRSNVADAWSAPSLVAEVSSTFQEKSPAISADGLTLWVASDRPGGQGGLDIWVSTRATRTTDWLVPVRVTALNSPGDEIPRPPGQDGLIMPLGYRGVSNLTYQIDVASRSALDASWMAPAPLSEVDTANIDVDGFLSDDGLTLHFSTDRLHKGDQDLYVAHRSGVGDAFTAFAPLGGLNTPDTDRDPWLSPDGTEIYFSSDRSGALRIYRATRVGVAP